MSLLTSKEFMARHKNLPESQTSFVLKEETGRSTWANRKHVVPDAEELVTVRWGQVE